MAPPTRHRRATPLPTRRPVVIANWKMYLGFQESVRVAGAIRSLVGRMAGRAVDVVLCPSFPALIPVREALAGSRLLVGAQDLHPEADGPYTGDVPAAQLRGLVRAVIVGHSERRRGHGETDEQVAAKVRRALTAALVPIICVGETAEERAAGDTVKKITGQVRTILAGVSPLSLIRCVFAYEPVWAISKGPGQPRPQPEPADAAELMGLIRKLAADHAGSGYAAKLRVVYGGSVQARTTTAFVCEPGVDGVLVGAASTKAGELATIVRAVVACHS